MIGAAGFTLLVFARLAVATPVLQVANPSAAALPNPVPLQPPSKPECPIQTPPKTKGTTPIPADELAVKPSAKNTLWFDHYWLRPACDGPMVLSVEDGDYFQVVIQQTDTTQFSYTITAVPDQEVPTSTAGATGPGLAPIRWSDMSLTMHHSKVFARYRVTISLRSDLSGAGPARVGDRLAGGPKGAAPTPERGPELFPATFDVWVKTKASFEVAFLGGAAFSGLRSRHYFIETDDRGTADTKDDTKTVREDSAAKDRFRPDTIAVANLRLPDKWKGFGLAFGVGLNNDADPRYFFGPSYFFGRHFLLHAGWAGGRVDSLPDGQIVDKPAINGDDTLKSLPKRFAHALYAAVSFGFIPGAEDSFKGAFGSTQKAVKPGGNAQEPEPPTNAPKVDLAQASGTYTATDNKSTRSVALTGSDHADWTITVKAFDAGGKPIGSDLTLKHTEGATFADDGDAHICTFTPQAGPLLLKCFETQHDPKTNKDKPVKTFEGSKAPDGAKAPDGTKTP
jgi:hypothetical protein